MEGRCPPAGGGSAPVDSQRRAPNLKHCCSQRVDNCYRNKRWSRTQYTHGQGGLASSGADSWGEGGEGHGGFVGERGNKIRGKAQPYLVSQRVNRSRSQLNLQGALSPTMESDHTFVAPEGVYSLTEDHKPVPPPHTAPPPVYPTRLSTITVRFPATKQPAIQGLGQLLGGGKDFWKEKGLAPTVATKEDGVSVSSGETPEDVTSPDAGATQDATTPTSITVPDQPHGLFGPPPPTGGKRRGLSRPKHNIRTTSSTFITRLQCVEGLAKALQAKQGEATYVFYNSARNFYWVEAGVQAKVRFAPRSFAKSSNRFPPLLGSLGSCRICGASNLSRRESFHGLSRAFRHYHRLPNWRSYMVR